MVYIIYITTNIINKKIYVGIHQTKNPYIFDQYLGDGVYSNSPKTYNCRLTPFHCAVAKYGPSNFVRKTLFVFNTQEEALAKEAEIVNQEFIERVDTYNITLGGGLPPNLSKMIYQYDLKGYFIKSWKSIKSITDFFNVNKDRIRMVIDSKRSFEQSYWSEIRYEQLDITNYRSSARGSIRQYTISGVLLHTFKNATEAAKCLDIDRKQLASAMYDKYTIQGCWFLKEDETIESYLDGSVKKEPKVYCYSNSGDFIKCYKTISEVKKDLKINKNDLKRAVKNNDILNNYYWSLSKYDNIILECPSFQTKVPKKVYQYTLEGDFVKEWESIEKCRKEFPAVLQVLLGKRNHCHKFKFSFDKLMIQSDTLSNKG